MTTQKYFERFKELEEDTASKSTLTITVCPMDNQQHSESITKADREIMAEYEQKVIAWLKEAPENQALFAYDHSRALRAALPDVDPDFLDLIDRANRLAKRAAGPASQPDFDEIEVKVQDTEG